VTDDETAEGAEGPEPGPVEVVTARRTGVYGWREPEEALCGSDVGGQLRGFAGGRKMECAHAAVERSCSIGMGAVDAAVGAERVHAGCVGRLDDWYAGAQ
jgi:hypothetical protein